MEELNPVPARGRFITFEGADGSGKTTQIAHLARTLSDRGTSVVTTREPGGSPGADAIRDIVLNGRAEGLGVETEAILFAAARRDHIRSLIEPALEAGAFVLCDRFIDSTRAYQGIAEGSDAGFLRELENATIAGTAPDLTLILDLPLEVGLARMAHRRGNAAPDRFEKDGLEIQKARRHAFLSIAKAEPERCVVVDAGLPEKAVSDRIAAVVFERFGIAVPDSFEGQRTGSPS